MFNKKIYYFLLISFFVAGCKKDDISFPVEPKIEVTVSPGSVHQYSDALSLTIHYEDGDGDLGENKDLVKNCFVTDNRINITNEYRIKQLGPSDTSIPIEGNVIIDLGGQVLTDSSSQQSITFTVYVVDRAGHKSNVVTTSAVSIIK